MANLGQQVFTNNGSWTAPAGVTSVTVVSKQQYVGPNPNIQVAFNNMMALSSVGQLYTWGENGIGQLGTNDSVNTLVSSPVQVVGNILFSQIQNGRNNGYGISQTGQLYAWGANNWGQLGTNSDPNVVAGVSSPVLVLGKNAWSQITSATYDFQQYVMGLTSSGKAYGWGYNGQGNIGDATTVDKSSPTAVVGNLVFSKLVLDGNRASVYGFASDGNLYAWGNGGSGALGIGAIGNKNSPNLVVGNNSFVQLSANTGNVIALRADGVAFAWGDNSNGNLGLGDRVARSSPVQVLGNLKFKQVIAMPQDNGLCTLGLTTSGQLYGWGDNSLGQLGLGDVIPRSSPVAVVGGLTFQSFTCTGEVVIALATNGQLYGWGTNGNGVLGNGTRTTISSPVAVVGGLLFADCPVMHYQIDNVQAAFAYSNTGKLYAWGQNQSSGVLGLGDTAPRSSPVLVLNNFAPKTATPVNTVTIQVVPGTTYTLTMKHPNPTLGVNSLANFAPTSVTLYFEQ